MLLLLSAALASGGSADEFEHLLDRMVRSYAATRDATFVLHQQERVGGTLGPVQRIDVKLRTPQTVHMTWLDGPSAGQVLLYSPDWNGGKLRVDPGPAAPTLDLDPFGWLATRNQRHDVTYVGPRRTIELFVADHQRVKASGGALTPVVKDLGSQVVHGAPSRCLDIQLPKDREPALYAHRVEVCVADAHGLPTRVRAWEMVNGQLQLVESYGYENLRVNVGLADHHFDPAAAFP